MLDEKDGTIRFVVLRLLKVGSETTQASIAVEKEILRVVGDRVSVMVHQDRRPWRFF